MKHSLLSVWMLVLGAVVMAQNPAPSPAMTSVPLLSCQGFPCVEATIAGRQVRMLIDSGNVNSALDQKSAIGLSLRPVHTPDGKVVPGFQFADLTSWQLSGHAMGAVKLLVQDLSSYVAKGQMPASDGTLAYSAFDGRLLVIDYVHQRLAFSEPLTAPVPCRGCGKLERITFGHHGPPILVGSNFRVNGRPLRAQIDSLYGGSMLIYPASVAKLGLTAAQAAATDRQFFPFTDGGVTMLRGAARSENYGSHVVYTRAALYFATPGVHVPDGLFEGTIGAAFLASHVLRLNLHDAWFSID